MREFRVLETSLGPVPVWLDIDIDSMTGLAYLDDWGFVLSDEYSDEFVDEVNDVIYGV